MKLLRGIIAFALLTMLMAWPAAAQQDTPIIGSQATEDAGQPTQDAPRRVLVIGDGLAGGLGAGLSRMAEAEGAFEVVNRFQEASGLARPEVYDWSVYLPNIMQGKNFTDVVVLLGTNDRQGIRSGNFRYAFNSPEWVKAYRSNTGDLLDILKSMGVRVTWVALPPMGDAKYEADMQAIAALQKQDVEARGAIYLDLRKEFLASDGSYTDTGADDTGEVRKLRASDGISFFKQGNNRFGQLVLAALQKDAEAPSLALKPAEDSPPQEAVSAVPEFGMSSSDGTISTYQPEAKRIAENAAQAPPPSASAPLSRDDVPKGSIAERLFTMGETDAPPPGRFDDYTMPKPAE